jgi:hypothetical protein
MIGTLVFIAFWVLLLPAVALIWCQRVKSRTRARIAAIRLNATAMRADQQNAWIWKGDSRGIYGHNCPVIDLDTAGTDNPRQVYGWPDYNGLLTAPEVKKPATVDVAVVADQSGFADIQGLDQQLLALFQTPLPDVGSGIRQPSFTCPRCGATSYNPNDIREKYCGSCHAWTGKTGGSNVCTLLPDGTYVLKDWSGKVIGGGDSTACQTRFNHWPMPAGCRYVLESCET